MSKTIMKNLKLKASLDDQALKRQLQELKKQFGDIQLGGNNLQNFDRSVKALNEAAASLKAAIGEMKKISDGGIGGGRGKQSSAQLNKSKSAADTITEQITKNASKKIKEIFDSQRGTYKTLRPGEVYDQSMGKKFRTDMQHQQALDSFTARSAKKEREADTRAAEGNLKKEAKLKAEQRRLDINNAKGGLAAVLSRTGMGFPMARQLSNVIGEAAPGSFARVGAGIRGLGSSIGGALATPAGMAVGGVAGAAAIGAYGYMNNVQRNREFREIESRQMQERGLSMLSGRGLEGNILKTARGKVGLVEGSLAAAGGMLSSFNPFSENFATNPFRAGRSRITMREEAEQKAALSETELSRSALGKSRELRQSRMAAMRGGTSGSDLNFLQSAGAYQGFSAEETLQQLQSAKQSLGGSAAVGALPMMQRMMQATGIGVGEQSGAAEIFTGSRRGQGMGTGIMQTSEVIKKGVAAGLDISKSGQFLKLTADFISANQGLGQLSTDDISSKLAMSMRGFAGGGAVTETNMRQAQMLQDQIRSESISTGGFAGLGNIGGVSSALGSGASVGQFLGAQGLSSNATVEDTMQALGVDRATAEKIISSKQNNLGSGLDMAGITDPALRTALGARETGQTTEQMQGRLNAQGFVGPGLDTAGAGAQIAAAGAGVAGSPEAQSLIVDFKTQQAAFVQGMGLMTTETGKANENLKIFNSELLRSVRMLNKYLGQTMDNSGQ